MTTEEAKAELKQAMSGAYGKHWVYGQSVRVVLDALATAEKELSVIRTDRTAASVVNFEQMAPEAFAVFIKTTVEEYITQYTQR